MEYKSIKGYTGIAQLGFLFVFLGLGFILAGIAQLVIGLKMIPPGTPMAEMGQAMLTAMKNPENVFYTRLAQICGTFFLLLIPALLFSWISNGRNRFWLGFNPYVNIFQLALGFLIMFTANIMASPLAEMSRAITAHFPALDNYAKHLETVYNDQVVVLSNLKSWSEFLMALAIMAFFPALFEEIFFRGAMQNFFVKWWKKPLLAIIVTSLVFSLIHGSVYLFISRAVLGFVLGLMFFRTKNIWVNVFAHFLNNAIALGQMFAMSKSKQKIDISKLDPKVEWWFAIIAIGVLFFLFRFLERYSVKNRYKIEAKEKLLIAASASNPFVKNEMNEFGNQ
ncbi:MAG: CPBP family intramembrane glutamic endopeptidase [Ferruginibacter sp.]